VAAQVSVCITPGDDFESLVVRHINAARRSVRVQAYYLTSTTILRALRAAAARGVKVEAILDRVNARKRTASATYLSLAAADVWIDDAVSIAHNKIMIIDGDEVIGGSFNYTKSAQTRNAENVTFLDGQEIAAAFERNWEARRAAATKLYPVEAPTTPDGSALLPSSQ
jgi:phosphatidylserine/phosphatidylglycerophosphate/cardiolipin synthase-like enzyme